MNMCRWLWLGLLPALLAAATAEMEDLVRKGNAAFHRGDFAAAAQCYQRAQARATDPRLVAFNLATANYYLARAGEPAALGAAEEAYRSCLERDDPRRAEALFGLGNCLLVRGSAGKLDPLPLRAAIDRYTECLREPGCDARLAADARHNQQRARLLLLQAPPVSAEGPEQDPGGEEKPRDDRLDNDRQNEKQRSQGGHELTPDRGNPGAASKDHPGEHPDARPSGGRGQLPPIPDQADAPPLSSHDAARHLDGAWRRIHDDLIAHRRARTRASAPGVRDW